MFIKLYFLYYLHRLFHIVFLFELKFIFFKLQSTIINLEHTAIRHVCEFALFDRDIINFEYTFYYRAAEIIQIRSHLYTTIMCIRIFMNKLQRSVRELLI